MVSFFAMKRALPPPTERKPEADSDWVKTPYPNLIRYKPSDNYFGRVRVNGKLIRRSLEPMCLTERANPETGLGGAVRIAASPVSM